MRTLFQWIDFHQKRRHIPTDDTRMFMTDEGTTRVRLTLCRRGMRGPVYRDNPEFDDCQECWLAYEALTDPKRTG